MLVDDITTIRAHFVTNWTACPVIYDMQPNTTMPKDGAWGRLSVQAFSSVHYSGSTEHGELWRDGMVWFQIFVPNNTGDAQLLALADAFATLFRHWNSDDGAIHCRSESIGAPDPDAASGFTMIAVSIPWESLRQY